MAASDDSEPRPTIRYPRARLSPAKVALMILTIPRTEVEAGNIAPVAQQLESGLIFSPSDGLQRRRCLSRTC
ncbi:hypothetical protein [Halochromatium glycolicum]|uniref:Uncharacterized protein n=1 Tax=Halochromatium glycolicum TaxID=85075 RepID=A0AAJ0U1V9_9GAMM|nr:hypothetical protein [Halochromatium glycolicum]MBK1703739.1 hypothetical protein [Halochromatium glycolicum]